MLKDRYSSQFVFQQGNARPHIYEKIKDYFNEDNIRTMSWHTYSPNLSLIESALKIIKDLVYITLKMLKWSKLIREH